MSRSVKFTVSIILILLTVFSPSGVFVSQLSASAATFQELNKDEVFLKQKTPVTCTLASAAMLMRRTAICASYSDWEDITEENIRETAWVDGVGLLWNFTCFNIKIGHGYFQSQDIKSEMLSLLDKNPQGLVIYNTGNEGQTHAVFLCDYDKESDVFYVADPAPNAPEGKITLEESTIVGQNQEEKLKNIAAYWYVVDPVVTVDEKGNYVAEELPSSGEDQYDPIKDLTAFNETKSIIKAHYVVSYDSDSGVALRTNPSGNSSIYKRVQKGTILYITYSGQNDFGATWYKTNSGHYIFSSNLESFEDYSAEITKFRNTAKKVDATYTVNAENDTRTALRLEPAEGNNIVAYADNDTKLYIVQSGVNSVGAAWLKTEEGYYVKSSQMKFVKASKDDDAGYTGSTEILSGSYSAKPIEDVVDESDFVPVEYKITASILNVRKSAVDGDVIGTLPKDTVVVVTTVLSGWGKISYNGADGWISLDYAEKISSGQTIVKFESVRLSDDLVYTGDSVQCTVNILSDVACMYKYSVYNDSGIQVYGAPYHITSNKFSFSPDKAGVYYFSIDVMCSDGRTLSGYSGNFTVRDKLKLKSVKSNIDAKTVVGNQIKWTVTAESYSENATYNYALYHNGELVLKKQSISSSLKYTPEKTGKYVLLVYLADEFTASEKLKATTVTVCDPLKISSIVLSSDYISVNEEISCNIKTSDGTGNNLYCFAVFKGEDIVKNGSYSSSDEGTFSFAETGTYRIFCAVKDSTGKAVTRFSTDIIVSGFKLGDVTGDGKITAGDSRAVLRHSAGVEKLPENMLATADVNRDNAVNAADARKILRCSANLEKI